MHLQTHLPNSHSVLKRLSFIAVVLAQFLTSSAATVRVEIAAQSRPLVSAQQEMHSVMAWINWFST